MIILRKGAIPGERVHHGSCNYCGCKIQFKESEAELIHDSRDGDYLQMKCPTKGCASNIVVSQKYG